MRASEVWGDLPWADFASGDPANKPMLTGLPVFNVTTYGALGNGTHDDTAAIQAAINNAQVSGGNVFFPPGTYRITSTLQVGDGTRQFQVNLVGTAMTATVLSWQGSTSGTCIRVNQDVYYRFANFSVANGSGGQGTTNGIWVYGTQGTGTTSYGALYEQVLATGFANGFHLGSWTPDQACSEYTFVNCFFNSNGNGVLTENYNTLDLTFIQLQMAANAYGVYMNAGGAVNVLGGSASRNTAADFYYNNGDSLTVSGFRSESANRFYVSSGQLSLFSGCSVVAGTNPDGYVIQAGAEKITIAGCFIDGKISVFNGTGPTAACSVNLLGSYIGDTVPFHNNAQGDDVGSYRVLGCYGPNGVLFPDQAGVSPRSGLIPLLSYASGGNSALNAWYDGIIARHALAVPKTAPNDPDLGNGSCSLWLDETNNNLVARVRRSDGSYQTATIPVS